MRVHMSLFIGPRHSAAAEATFSTERSESSETARKPANGPQNGTRAVASFLGCRVLPPISLPSPVETISTVAEKFFEIDGSSPLSEEVDPSITALHLKGVPLTKKLFKQINEKLPSLSSLKISNTLPP